MTMQSGRSVGPGSPDGSDVFQRPPGGQPSLAAPLATDPTSEEEDSASTESYTSATVEPMDSVDSRPSADAEFNTGAPRRYDESPVDPCPAPSQSELDDTMGNDMNDTLEASALSVINVKHDDGSTVVYKPSVSTPQFNRTPPARAMAPTPPDNSLLLQSIQQIVNDNTNKLQARIDDVRVDAGQRSAQMREIIYDVECKMMTEMRYRLIDVRSNMARLESSMMNEINAKMRKQQEKT